MRLIDADALLQEIEESANAVEIQIHLGKCNKDVAKGMLSGLALVRENVLRKPTAYDPEKVVAELEDKFERTVAEILDKTGSDFTIADFNVKRYSDRICEIVRKGGTT